MSATQQRISDSPEFRKARARLGGLAVAQRHPDLARERGRRGGQATAQSYPGGPTAFGVALAMKRWHGMRLRPFGGSMANADPATDDTTTPANGSVDAPSKRKRRAAKQRES